MKELLLKFCHRGLIFGGFGPIVYGIVVFILEKCGTPISVSGGETLLAVVSIYLCAFIHAGASIFPQIESWSKVKAMIFQFGFIYIAYTVTYLINHWIPFDYRIILTYTGCFLFGFLLIWVIVYLSTKASAKSLNQKLKQNQNIDL